MRNPIVLSPYGNAEGWILTQQQARILRLLVKAGALTSLEKAGALTSLEKAVDAIGQPVKVLDIDDFLNDGN